MNKSVFVNNSATDGGGIYNDVSATVSDSTFISNRPTTAAASTTTIRRQ